MRDIMKRKQEAKEQAEAAAEELERRKMEKQAELLAARGPYTYDSDGKIIWIRPPVIDQLPETSDSVLYDTGEQEEFSLEKSTTDASVGQITQARRSAVQLSGTR